ncbi:hypothetical protein MYX76_08130, partial [Desulfobacterota bacterium AH_259_B03_O07]|nr:hypothetical protein [Desulfobacterota bacterium AH_259_B03_O07]
SPILSFVEGLFLCIKTKKKNNKAPCSKLRGIFKKGDCFAPLAMTAETLTLYFDTLQLAAGSFNS